MEDFSKNVSWLVFYHNIRVFTVKFFLSENIVSLTQRVCSLLNISFCLYWGAANFLLVNYGNLGEKERKNKIQNVAHYRGKWKPFFGASLTEGKRERKSKERDCQNWQEYFTTGTKRNVFCSKEWREEEKDKTRLAKNSIGNMA